MEVTPSEKKKKARRKKPVTISEVTGVDVVTDRGSSVAAVESLEAGCRRRSSSPKNDGMEGSTSPEKEVQRWVFQKQMTVDRETHRKKGFEGLEGTINACQFRFQKKKKKQGGPPRVDDDFVDMSYDTEMTPAVVTRSCRATDAADYKVVSPMIPLCSPLLEKLELPFDRIPKKQSIPSTAENVMFLGACSGSKQPVQSAPKQPVQSADYKVVSPIISLCSPLLEKLELPFDRIPKKQSVPSTSEKVMFLGACSGSKQPVQSAPKQPVQSADYKVVSPIIPLCSPLLEKLELPFDRIPKKQSVPSTAEKVMFLGACSGLKQPVQSAPKIVVPADRRPEIPHRKATASSTKKQPVVSASSSRKSALSCATKIVVPSDSRPEVPHRKAAVSPTKKQPVISATSSRKSVISCAKKLVVPCDTRPDIPRRKATVLSAKKQSVISATSFRKPVISCAKKLVVPCDTSPEIPRRKATVSSTKKQPVISASSSRKSVLSCATKMVVPSDSRPEIPHRKAAVSSTKKQPVISATSSRKSVISSAKKVVVPCDTRLDIPHRKATVFSAKKQPVISATSSRKSVISCAKKPVVPCDTRPEIPHRKATVSSTKKQPVISASPSRKSVLSCATKIVVPSDSRPEIPHRKATVFSAKKQPVISATSSRKSVISCAKKPVVPCDTRPDIRHRKATVFSAKKQPVISATSFRKPVISCAKKLVVPCDTRPEIPLRKATVSSTKKQPVISASSSRKSVLSCAKKLVVPCDTRPEIPYSKATVSSVKKQLVISAPLSRKAVSSCAKKLVVPCDTRPEIPHRKETVSSAKKQPVISGPSSRKSVFLCATKPAVSSKYRYVLFNGILQQLIIYTMENIASLFTYPLLAAEITHVDAVCHASEIPELPYILGKLLQCLSKKPRAHFETESTRFTILHAPISGASLADIGVLVISAREGEFETGCESCEETREHVQLTKTWGVSKLLVVVNKMDDPTVNWSKERYDEIESRMVPFLKLSGFGLAGIAVLLEMNLDPVQRVKFRLPSTTDEVQVIPKDSKSYAEASTSGYFYIGKLVVAPLLNWDIKMRSLLRNPEKATTLFGEQEEEKLQMLRVGQHLFAGRYEGLQWKKKKSKIRSGIGMW
ncbi:hypothetical protein SSX86_001445 [Deinandra increscens subsp. villosa]|uniref:Tr-type G domain-containing protein n=1 Tax=Deinandra increscens subsp. villosa TaxID=3103831 RepID=A0AAP0DW71_9ASTR